MLLARRNFIVGSAAAVLLARGDFARAAVTPRMQRLIREALARRFAGYAKASTSFTQQGYFANKLLVDFELADDFSFVVYMSSAGTLDGVTYTARLKGSGAAWANEDGKAGITVFDCGILYADRLPNNWQWEGIVGSLEFANDAENKGHFYLSGNMRSAISSNVQQVLLSDYQATTGWFDG